MKKNQGSRRIFLNKIVGASALLATSPTVLSAAQLKREPLLSTNKFAALPG